MPFTDKEKQLLRWIQEDTISGDVVVSEEEAVETRNSLKFEF